MRSITLIVLHCSATRADRSYSFQQCKADHLHRGYRDIGYHFYVTRDGTLHEGRPLAQVGAHCRNHNKYSVGICYEGGIDTDGRPADTRTESQKSTLRELLVRLKRAHPRAVIVGHRDLSPDLDRNGRITPDEWTKQCPCFDAVADYADLQPGK